MSATKQGWAMQIGKTGDYGVFEKITIPHSAPGPDEVGIEVQACGVNFADVLMRMGLYPEAPKTPFIPGYEVAGVVSAIGSDVTDLQVGDRVMAATYFGGYASYALAKADKVLPLPEHLSFVEGASLLVNFMTAWVALHEMARVRPGDQVLIHGIAGGVGLSALQVAKNAGCVVYGTAGSQDKLDYAKARGLDYGINYRKSDFVADIRLNLGRRPVDVILDPIGGDNIAKDHKVLKPTGKIIVFGMAKAVGGEKANKLKSLIVGLKMFHVNLLGLFSQNHGVFGLNVLRLWKYPIMRDVGQAILKAFEARELETVVDKTFPLEQAGEAHRYLQDRKNMGKVVLTL